MTETDNVIVNSEECIFMCIYGWISAQIICVHCLHEPSNPSKVGYSGHSDYYIRSVLYNYQQKYHKVLDRFIITWIGKSYHIKVQYRKGYLTFCL